MNRCPAARLLGLCLAVSVAGLTGFLDPVLCIAENGRVRLEADASFCRAETPPDAQGRDLALLAGASSGLCGNCTDIHFAIKGLQAAGDSRFPLSAPHAYPVLASLAPTSHPSPLLSPASIPPPARPITTLRC